MNLKHPSGTTLIELIAVLLLISIVSAVTIVKYNDDSNLTVEADILKSNLQYVQILSLSDENHSWKIKFTGSGDIYTAYTLFCDDATEKAVFFESGNSTHHFPENISVSTSGGPEIVFDKFGSIKGLTGNYIITLKKTELNKKIFKINRAGYIDEDP